ncbi:MAG: RNA polymerase sigma factor [Planctomycetota bacterium]|jgi:RNA polymerase sigma-70 factor (ECF subfamily)
MISFKELVERYSKPVLNSAFRIAGNHQYAQDIHQEVFLAILRRWDRFNGDTNWGAYLYRVTVRKAIEFVKRSRLEQQIGSADDWAAVKENPAGLLRSKELQHELLRRLGKLPKRQADVFVLSRIEGLSDRRIAEIMGLAPQTVRVHLCRALERLRGELKGFLADR